MKLKDLIYMALAFFTVKLLRKPTGKQESKTPNKIPPPEKIIDHAAPPRGNDIEPHFKPAEAKMPVEPGKKPVEEIARDISDKLDIMTPFIPRKPEDMFRDHSVTGRENDSEIKY